MRIETVGHVENGTFIDVDRFKANLYEWLRIIR